MNRSPELPQQPAPGQGPDASAPAPREPDAKTVATPEGDNEFAPDQPLKPIDGGRQKPPAIDTNKL